MYQRPVQFDSPSFNDLLGRLRFATLQSLLRIQEQRSRSTELVVPRLRTRGRLEIPWKGSTKGDVAHESDIDSLPETPLNSGHNHKPGCWVTNLATTRQK